MKQAQIIGEIFHKSKITEHLKELKRDCTMKQSYIVLSVVIPIVILCVGLIYPPHIVAAAMIVIKIAVEDEVYYSVPL